MQAKPLEPGCDCLVKVIPAEAGIAAGRKDFKDAIFELENGDIECAASEVIDSDGRSVQAVESDGETGCGGFIDDAVDGEAGECCGIACGLALCIVEVCGHGDHGFDVGCAECGGGACGERLEDMGCDGGCGDACAVWEEDLAIGCNCVGKAIGCHFAIAGPAAHQTLGGINGGQRIRDEEVFCSIPYDDSTVCAEVDDAWEQCIPGLRIWKDGWNPINGGCNE